MKSMSERGAYSWILLPYLITWTAVSAMSSDQAWTVRMGAGDTLSVESKSLYVEFSKRHAWTIRNIKYMGQVIVGGPGANGTVVNATPGKGMNPKDPWYGTGHGKEDIKSFSVLVDNIPHEFQEGMTLSGKVITVRKESTMGPLGHTAQITFPESGDCILEKHSYIVLEDLNEGFRFVYAFMHSNNNALDQWLALLGSGKEQEGQAGKKDDKFGLGQDIKGIVFYSEALGKGVIYVYPEVYRGADTFKNSIWDREHDNKLYFRPEIRDEDFKVGSRFEFHLKVIPFSAQQTDWKETGRTLAGFGAN